MSLMTTLVGLGIKQVVGESVDAVVAGIAGWFNDPSQELPRAIERATDRAWDAVALALAGDTLLGKVRQALASGMDDAVADHIRRSGFIQASSVQPVWRISEEHGRRGC